MRAATPIAFALAGALLTACGASDHQSGMLAPTFGQKGTATMKIIVPKSTSANTRKPDYVSPATTQMSIDVQQSGTSVSGYPVTVGLTPTSTGCTSTLTSTLCELTISLAPGSYTATLTAMDSSGTALSAAQSIAVTITPGTSNTISLTLSGVPKEIQVLPLDGTTPGSAAQGYTIVGSGAHRFLVVALDADGDAIVGPGAPAFSASMTGFSGTIAGPTTAKPNMFTISPPSAIDSSSGTVTVTASYSGQATDACAQTGAVCTASIAIGGMKELVAIPTSTGVDLYEQGQSTKLLTLTTAANAQCVTFDSNGNLFVGESGREVEEFSPPFWSGMSASGSVTMPQYVDETDSSNNIVQLELQKSLQLVTDNAGHLYDTVQDRVGQTTTSALLQFPVPLATGTVLLWNGYTANPISLSADSHGNVFAAAEWGEVTEFAADGTATDLAITQPSTGSLYYLAAAKSDGTLALSNGTSVAIYSAPYTGTPVTVTTSQPATGLAFSTTGDLYVGEQGLIEDFASPYTGSASSSQSTSSSAENVVTGPNSDIFTNVVGTGIEQFAVPFTGASATTYSAISKAYAAAAL